MHAATSLPAASRRIVATAHEHRDAAVAWSASAVSASRFSWSSPSAALDDDDEDDDEPVRVTVCTHRLVLRSTVCRETR